MFCLRLMHIFTISKTLGPKIIIVKRMVRVLLRGAAAAAGEVHQGLSTPRGPQVPGLPPPGTALSRLCLHVASSEQPSLISTAHSQSQL